MSANSLPRLTASQGLTLAVWLVATLLFSLRLLALDLPPFLTHDESYSVLRTAGYLEREVRETLFQSRLVSLAEVQHFHQLTSERTFWDTITGLATEEPQLPPLYFLLARLWRQVFGGLGDVITVLRGFSVLLGFLVLPVSYWLCQELFASRVIAQVTILFLAGSPNFLRLSLNVRYFTLWALLSLSSTALLLLATRTTKTQWWIAYGLSFSLSLYTFPLTAFMAVSHGLFVWHRNRQELQSWAIATLAAGLLFIPWAVTWLIHIAASQDTLRFTFPAIAAPWPTRIDNFSQLLRLLFLIPINRPVAWAIALLCLIALIDLRREERSVAWGLATLILLPFLIFGGLDLLDGGTRLAKERYFIPSLIFWQIAVARYLCRVPLSRRIRIGITLILVLGGLLSTLSDLRPERFALVAAAQQQQRPLIVSDLLTDFTQPGNRSNPMLLVGFSYALPQNTVFWLQSESDRADLFFPLLTSYNALVFRPTPVLRDRLQQKFQLEDLSHLGKQQQGEDIYRIQNP
ncbi:MAG: hypothetical protein HC919_03335 [Oscillatoriales cyanobacterium SM2_2_1]|nr:hypothetical protein [Oscillatoriales cyanobacterium SM2_2_1]